MKKIIYLNELEVNLGDSIEIGGMIVIVTQELIDSNPNKFKITERISEYVKCIKSSSFIPSCYKIGGIYRVINSWILTDNGNRSCKYTSLNGQTDFIESTKEEYDLQELIKEAKLRYPIGTKFYPAHISIEENRFCTVTGSEVEIGFDGKRISIRATNNTSNWVPNIYYFGKWAEIIPERKLLGQDELGNNIYAKEKLTLVYPSLEKCTFNVNSINVFSVNHEDVIKFFVNEIDADEYIRKNQILLTTEDCVKIKSKESVYWVCCNEDSEFDSIYDYGFLKEITKVENNIVKYFAKRENAEKYILSKLYKG